MRIILVICVLILFGSCKVYHMYDGKSRPVTFRADSTVFDQDSHNKRVIISYADLAFLNGTELNDIDLVLNKDVQAIIADPTVFFANGKFLLFPGDKIIVSKNNSNEFVLKSTRSKTRTRELMVLNKFEELEKMPFQIFYRDPSLDTMFRIEKEIKDGVDNARAISIHLFDSLQIAYKTSKRFKDATKNYVKNRYSFLLLSLYKHYKDSLVIRDLYKKKSESLLPIFNSLLTTSEIENCIIPLNEFASIVLPFNIHKINDSNQFEADFNEIEKLFSGIVRDYLLTQLAYTAYTKRISFDLNHLNRAISSSISGKYYQKIITKIISTQNIDTSINKGEHRNNLLSMKGVLSAKIEDIVKNNNGKVVFLDFMASWCAPCREDLPSIKSLKKYYSKDDIIFINVSLDNKYQPWRKFIYSSKLDTKNSYMLINRENSQFMTKYKIETIPRYLIFDKTGGLVDSNAPRANDKRLKHLIDSIINKNQPH